MRPLGIQVQMYHASCAFDHVPPSKVVERLYDISLPPEHYSPEQLPMPTIALRTQDSSARQLKRKFENWQ